MIAPSSRLPIRTSGTPRDNPAQHSSCEQSVQVPAEIAGAGVLAVAAAVEPEAGAAFLLDLEIIADGIALRPVPPPFAIDALGAVGGDHPIGPAAPFEADRGAVGKVGHDLLDRFRRRKQPDRP